MLQDLFRTGLALGLTAALASAQARDGRASSRWGADYFPNVPLVTHEGREVRFFDDLVKDKVVVISFIYTSCADACPLETAKLSEVQALLGERMGRDVFFCSISIDPERDTPAVLHAYAERFGAGPGWQFLTGTAEDIKLVRRKLGMIAPGGETQLSEHTLSLLIGNQATGQWMKRSPFDSPHLLATQVGSWLTNWKAPRAAARDYADAPELRSLSKGESLFRTRCATCHVLGTDDGFVRQGPPLAGVTMRRERAWLARWLREPDVMLAEKDPLAQELFTAWRGVVMPNLRLTSGEVEDLLEYMQAEDERLARSAAATAPVPEPPPCCEKEALDVLSPEPARARGIPSGRPASTPSQSLFLALSAVLLLGGLAAGSTRGS